MVNVVGGIYIFTYFVQDKIDFVAYSTAQGQHLIGRSTTNHHRFSGVTHMAWCRFKSLRRWGYVWFMAAAGCAAPALAPASELALPPVVEHAMPGASLAGEGQLRVLGFRVYDARLWVGPRFEAQSYAAHALVLELTYHRSFTGEQIARRSVDEMRRQRGLDDAQAARWQAELAQRIPDVRANDRLIGLYQPGLGMRLWRGAQALGAIEDAELARLFFGIWLSPQTSEPGLRSALLARLAGAAR